MNLQIGYDGFVFVAPSVVGTWHLSKLVLPAHRCGLWCALSQIVENGDFSKKKNCGWVLAGLTVTVNYDRSLSEACMHTVYRYNSLAAVTGGFATGGPFPGFLENQL